jgi:G3E family GTPase
MVNRRPENRAIRVSGELPPAPERAGTAAGVVVTGFLGAGKTTLVRDLNVEFPGSEVMNHEAGAASIPEHHEGVMMAYELGSTPVGEVIRDRFNRMRLGHAGWAGNAESAVMFVETSGLAAPWTILSAADAASIPVKLVLCVVDLSTWQDLSARPPCPDGRPSAVSGVWWQQANAASVLVGTKGTAEELAALSEKVGVNKRALLVEDRDALRTLIAEAIADGPDLALPRMPPYLNIWAEVWTCVFVGPYPLRTCDPEMDPDRIRAFLSEFLVASNALRFKALIAAPGGARVMQGVRDKVSVTFAHEVGGQSDPPVSKFVMMVPRRKDAERFKASLKDFLLKPAPRAVFTLTSIPVEA